VAEAENTGDGGGGKVAEDHHFRKDRNRAAVDRGFVWDMCVGIGCNDLGQIETLARYDWPDMGAFGREGTLGRAVAVLWPTLHAC